MMTEASARTRIPLAAALCAALVALTAGCAASDHDTPADGGPSPVGTPTTPGRVSVQVPGADLTINGAVAHLDRSGDGALTMSVRNEDGVPEHLDMVTTPDGGRGALAGDSSTEGNGSLSPAGILLQTGTTVTFGGSGPRILLRHVRGVTPQHTLPIALQFGVAGLVRLQARVTSP